MSVPHTSLLRSSRKPDRRDLGDLYLLGLAFGLLGYVLLGRGFAYLGAPPLYMGELLFLSGMAVAARSGCLVSLLTNGCNVVLILLGSWVLLQTIPYLRPYGIDAVRDSVVVLYGGFSLIVCSLLVQQPERLGTVFRMMRLFAFWYGPLAFFQYMFFKLTLDVMPTLPGSGIPLMLIRGGEVASHLAGATVFALLMFRRPGLPWLAFTLLGVGLVSSQSRGGMLAIAVPLLLASVLGGRMRALGKIACALAVMLAAAWLLDLEVPLNPDSRSLNARQLIENVVSVLGESQGGNLDDTKRWRLMWWESIIDYTFNGPYFWTGKGFGIGLAEADGFLVGDDESAVLRSPHNVHMTILGRAGVPGFLLWALLLSSWLGTMLWNMRQARRRGDVVWANFFLFIACYALSIVVNASFDVAMEGPMLGIWFWVLFGIGTGSSMIFRTASAEPHALRRLALQT